MKAGVMEDGQWFETKEGTPQGAVISPVPANLGSAREFGEVGNWRRLERFALAGIGHAKAHPLG
jgi:hypothetical protein